jgi:two-component system response regulator CpxR
VLIVDDVRLDPAAREVLIDGIPLDITSVEFSLLEALLRNAGHVVTREHLTQTVLGHKLGTFDRVIDVHVSNLRKKLSRVHAGERIKAIRGSGYQFVARSEAK